MRTRFFYGYGEEIHFKDRLKNGSDPISEYEKGIIEVFLIKIKAKMGFYMIDGTDISSLVLLQDCSRKDEGEYEEWCPHCGGCTLYDLTTESVQCMWCGEELLPCSMCRNFEGSHNYPCEWSTSGCRLYKYKNRLPDFTGKI